MSNYENEMRGERKKADFNNAQGIMKGEKGKKMKEPGGMESGPKKMGKPMGNPHKVRRGMAK